LAAMVAKGTTTLFPPPDPRPWHPPRCGLPQFTCSPTGPPRREMHGHTLLELRRLTARTDAGRRQYFTHCMHVKPIGIRQGRDDSLRAGAKLRHTASPHVFNTADLLISQGYKRTEGVFNCPVFGLDNCIDLGYLAWQSGSRLCYHTAVHPKYMEILHEARPAAMGEGGGCLPRPHRKGYALIMSLEPSVPATRTARLREWTPENGACTGANHYMTLRSGGIVKPDHLQIF